MSDASDMRRGQANDIPFRRVKRRSFVAVEYMNGESMSQSTARILTVTWARNAANTLRVGRTISCDTRALLHDLDDRHHPEVLVGEDVTVVNELAREIEKGNPDDDAAARR
jgi:hypothetical protein